MVYFIAIIFNIYTLEKSLLGLERKRKIKYDFLIIVFLNNDLNIIVYLE